MPSAAPFAEVRETHSGVVFLVGNRAYKCKKPIDLGFLDFRTLEQRIRCCEREVELNRRLAPDVYRGLARLTDPGTTDSEPLVLMTRMPDERRLSTLVRAGERLQDTVSRIARIMATFHAGAERSPAIAAEGTADAIARRWAASFAQVAPLAKATLGEQLATDIQQRVHAFLAGRQPLFEKRVSAGRIVDGHGDLICDDIFCLDDGPRILDCLEFDDRLRYVDGLDDISFLAMDLEKLGATGLAELLVDRYADFAGDPAPASLRHHYIAYRAFVRVKVHCLRHTQGDPSAAAETRGYADLALRHLLAGSVRMIVIGGLPGAGKSTVAGLTADRLGAVLLSSDRLRKELSNIAPMTRSPEPYREGIYDSEHTERTYAELLDRAARLLSNGESVVLDGSWTDARLRSNAARTATSVNAQLVEFECRAPAEIRRARLIARHTGMSDADPQIADRMTIDAAPWPTATRLTSADSPQECLRQVLSQIGIVDSAEFVG